MPKCKHTRENIKWRTAPTTDDNADAIFYYGKCQCGLRVREEYNSVGVFDAEDNNFICE